MARASMRFSCWNSGTENMWIAQIGAGWKNMTCVRAGDIDNIPVRFVCGSRVGLRTQVSGPLARDIQAASMKVFYSLIKSMG